jgi:hypothetical protein
MSARVDEELGDGVLSFFNGMKFKYNDLVDVIVGTGLGVRGNKTEPFKGQFKGVVETVRGVEFLVKPLVSGNGRCQQIPRHCVFKLQAFGTCVLGTRATRFFCKRDAILLQTTARAKRKVRVSSTLLVHLFCLSFTLVLFLFHTCFVYLSRVMRRANSELHESLTKERKEANRAKK